MNADPSELLRMLGVGPTAPVSKARAAGGKSDSIENAAFADLLARVEKGEIGSGLTVSVDRDADVSLNDVELAALSLAADKAEAAGIRRAVVLRDGEPLILDVHTRTVVGKADFTDGLLAGVDGVIRLDGHGDAEVSDKLNVPSAFVAANPSLAAALESRKAGGKQG